MAIATGITIEEFERLPDALAHNHELVNGALVDVPGNTPYHNKLRDLLIELLCPYVRNHKLGNHNLRTGVRFRWQRLRSGCGIHRS